MIPTATSLGAAPASLSPAGNSWNLSAGKRAFDLLLGLAALLVCLPAMCLVALAVRFTSSGPVLFLQPRVGKDGRVFRLVKFRTMRQGEPSTLRLTRSGDPRVTRVGRFLRKWKLDELPQLWNVVRGDMSFVGPRPDVAEYLAGLNDTEREILCVRPGITSEATLCYRNEEELLASVAAQNVTQFYCSQVLPDKIRIDLEYTRRASLWSDLYILLRTIKGIVA